MKLCGLLIALLMSSCVYGDQMKEIDSMMNVVIQSANAEKEAESIEEVWRYIAKERVFIQVFALDENQKETDINTLSEGYDIKTVKIVFSKGNTETSVKWTPKDKNNIFVLFQE